MDASFDHDPISARPFAITHPIEVRIFHDPFTLLKPRAFIGIASLVPDDMKLNFFKIATPPKRGRKWGGR